MWIVSDAYRSLVPSCQVCNACFDVGAFTPQVMPCGHSICSTCVKDQQQSKKQRCHTCSKKYSKVQPNYTLIEVVRNVSFRKSLLDSVSMRCDECDTKTLCSMLRRCFTCEQKIKEHIVSGLGIKCSVCLVCFIRNHKGHDMLDDNANMSNSSGSKRNCMPVACSTPRRSATEFVPGHILSALSKSNEIEHISTTPYFLKKKHGLNINLICIESPLYSKSCIEKYPTPPTTPSSATWVQKISSFARRWSLRSDDNQLEEPSQLQAFRFNTTGHCSSTNKPAHILRRRSTVERGSISVTANHHSQCRFSGEIKTPAPPIHDPEHGGVFYDYISP